MTHEEYNLFCAALPATTYVMQWGGAHVWKVGGKVFCIGGREGQNPAFSFKTSEIGFEMLREREGFRPAPYLASRGLKWIQACFAQACSAQACSAHDDGELRELIRQSHHIVAAGLSRKRRRELGLESAAIT